MGWVWERRTSALATSKAYDAKRCMRGGMGALAGR